MLFCLTVLASGQGFAQTTAEPPPDASQPWVSPPPLVPAPEPAEPSEPAEPPPPAGESIPYRYRPAVEGQDTAKRILLEALAGSGTGFVSGLAGALASVLVVGDCLDDSCVIPLLGAMGLGIVLGTPLGVYGVGQAMDAHGSYLAALGGTALGGLAGLVMAVLFNSIGSSGLIVVSLLATPLAGAVLGYELSVPGSRQEPLPSLVPASSEAAFQCVPVFGVTRAGSLIGGLAGRF